MDPTQKKLQDLVNLMTAIKDLNQKALEITERVMEEVHSSQNVQIVESSTPGPSTSTSRSGIFSFLFGGSSTQSSSSISTPSLPATKRKAVKRRGKALFGPSSKRK